MSITKKKYKLTKMSVNTYDLELMLIFLNISQLQKLMKKVILTETLFLVGCKFVRFNTSKRYDEEYEIGRIETFIGKFKNRQLKKLEK